MTRPVLFAVLTTNYTSTDPKQYGLSSCKRCFFRMAHCAIYVGRCTHDTLATFCKQDYNDARGNKRSVGPSALCLEPRRSLCRCPGLFVSGPALSLSGLALFVLGPGALCVGARRSLGALCRGPTLSRSLCRASALSVSGPSSLCGGRRCLCRARPLCRRLCRGPALFVSGAGASALSLSGRRSVSGLGALAARSMFSLSVSAHGALCVGARRSPGRLGPTLCVGSLYRGLALSRRSLCRTPVLSCRGPHRFVLGPGAVSGPSALYVGARRALCRALCRAPPLSGPGALPALCVGPGQRRYLCGLLSVSGPGALLCRAGALCVGTRRSLCLGPAGALCVGARRSLCRAPALSQHSLCRAKRSVCRDPASGPLSPALCVGVLSACHPCGPVVPQSPQPFIRSRDMHAVRGPQLPSLGPS